MYDPSDVDCTGAGSGKSIVRSQPRSVWTSASAVPFGSKTIGFLGKEIVELGSPTKSYSIVDNSSDSEVTVTVHGTSLPLLSQIWCPVWPNRSPTVKVSPDEP